MARETKSRQMTREELAERLRKHEWSDIEFKQARRAVPRDAYKTVSAFANTAGGWLVFGVREAGGALDVVGVVEVDKVQNDFLSTLRAGDKFNRVIAVKEQAEDMDGKTLLAFHVPESPRGEKPIYLRGDIRESYIRRGAGDERCTMPEIERFLRDAAADYDSQVVELDAEGFFDPDSLRWYRRLFEDRNPGRRQDPSDMEFLHEWGFVVEQDSRLAPTRAAVLVLGRARYVRQILHRPVVDYQFIDSTFDAWPPDLRWSDRIVVEENLVQAWLALSERYMRRADRPFGIDPATLRRDDDPPEYVSFREAAINLLLHQDYGEQHRHATIRVFRDRLEFRNPGDAFATTDTLLEPGAKDVRNPDIVAAFRRLGLSEQAGTGIRAIFRNWQELGHVPPVIDNDKTNKVFEVCFSREALLSDEQRLFQSRLGLRLSDAEARVFAFACRKGHVSLVDAKAVTGRIGAEASDTLEALQVQGVLQPLQDGLHRLAEHLEGRGDLPLLGQSKSDQVRHRRDGLVTDQAEKAPSEERVDQAETAKTDLDTDQASRPTTDLDTDQGREESQPDKPSICAGSEGSDLDTDQGEEAHPDNRTDQAATAKPHLDTDQEGWPMADLVTDQASPLSDQQRRVIAACDTPRSLAELMALAGLTHRSFFRNRHLRPLLDANIVRMTNPDSPNAANQRYVLTESGMALKASHLEGNQEGDADGRG